MFESIALLLLHCIVVLPLELGRCFCRAPHILHIAK
jgi:hypothetical protein